MEKDYRFLARQKGFNPKNQRQIAHGTKQFQNWQKKDRWKMNDKNAPKVEVQFVPKEEKK